MRTRARVAVVAVGDELLLGDVVDTNTGWIGRRLAEAGAAVVRGCVVGDHGPAITAAIRESAAVADLVVVTGGLGPTSDDVTAPALEAAAGATESVEEVANPVGTAAGLRTRVGGVTVVAVPGVPAEMRAMVDADVVPLVRDPAQALRVVELRTALVGESELADRLRPLEGTLPDGLHVAYLAGPAEVRIRIVGAAVDPGPTGRVARELLGDLVVGQDGESLEAAVCRILRERDATMASAESLTGGLLGGAVTSVPGASAVFLGGVVAYATPAKTALLGVDADLLERTGPVHADVAAAMARGVRERFGATYGVATTGVAGPEPQGGQPVGTVHVAVDGAVEGAAERDGAVRHSVLRHAVLRCAGERDVVRRRAVVAALELLRRTALGIAGDARESVS